MRRTLSAKLRDLRAIAREFQIVLRIEPAIDMELPVLELRHVLIKVLTLVIPDEDYFTVPVVKAVKKYFHIQLLTNGYYAIMDDGAPIIQPVHTAKLEESEDIVLPEENSTIADTEQEEQEEQTDPDLIPDKRFRTGYKGNKEPKAKSEPRKIVPDVVEIPSSGSKVPRYKLGRKIQRQRDERNALGGSLGGGTIPFSGDEPGGMFDREYLDE